MIHLQHKVLRKLATEKFEKLNEPNQKLILIRYRPKRRIPTLENILEAIDLRTLKVMEKEMTRMLTSQ